MVVVAMTCRQERQKDGEKDGEKDEAHRRVCAGSIFAKRETHRTKKWQGASAVLGGVFRTREASKHKKSEEGEGADSKEGEPQVVGMGIGRREDSLTFECQRMSSLFSDGKFLWIGYKGIEQIAGRDRTNDPRNKRIEVGISHVERLLSFGCLTGNILHIARAQEALCKTNQRDSQKNRYRDRMNGKMIPNQSWEQGNRKCRKGNESQTDCDGSDRLKFFAQPSDGNDREHHGDGIHVRIPLWACMLTDDAKDILWHRGVHLTLDDPEAGGDQNDRDQPS